MPFSYTRIILEDCEYPIYLRGKELFQTKKATITPVGTASCQALVKGSELYSVNLGSSRVGSPKFSCTCPYVTTHKIKTVCKHIVAASLTWDLSRSVEPPPDQDAKSLCLEEPEISYADIRKAYENPLKADLEVLRNTAEKLGSWSRAHSKLPVMPAACHEKRVSLILVKEALSEIRKWSYRSAFDHYFCAGEMMAAFCELIRWTKLGINAVSLVDQEAILDQLVRFQKDLILGMIDDSDGLHEFSRAHLLDLSDLLLNNLKEIKGDQTHITTLRSRADSIEW